MSQPKEAHKPASPSSPTRGSPSPSYLRPSPNRHQQIHCTSTATNREPLHHIYRRRMNSFKSSGIVVGPPAQCADRFFQLAALPVSRKERKTYELQLHEWRSVIMVVAMIPIMGNPRSVRCELDDVSFLYSFRP